MSGEKSVILDRWLDGWMIGLVELMSIKAENGWIDERMGVE